MYTFHALREELLETSSPRPLDGDVADIAGIRSVGDCSLRYVYRAESLRAPDDGMVLTSQPELPGRWELVHQGQGDFRWFGVFDEKTPADTALESMLGDTSISCISAHTPLNFQKRHRIRRSCICLDFLGNTVTAKGIEEAPHNDPFSGILHFTGEAVGEIHTVILTAPLSEQYDIFEVPDTTSFLVGSWWRVSCNALVGSEEKEIDKLLMVTEIIDASHVRFNYKMGWRLEAGRTLFYRQIHPVCDVQVQNMSFVGNEGGEAVGAQPVAFEFAVNCNAIGLHARHTYWPVILRRHNTGYRTSQCSLLNPTEVVVGGTGYLTQQIHCLYGSVRDCTTSNARHLNDFTGSAYCQVENCHGDGDFHGAFVTHGQFEHDLTYVGNSGLLSFANSGPTWGSSAKRITVQHHTGCWGLGFAKVTDLTLVDVAMHHTEKYEESGTLLLNADGLQVRGCRADRLVLTQRSSRSERPCVIENSYFRDGILISRDGEAAVTTRVIANNNREGSIADE